MNDFEVEGGQGKMTRQDFKRLLKLNLWCKQHEKMERSLLRRKFLKWFLNLGLSILGWLGAVQLILMGLLPPYVSLQFLLIAIGLVGVLIILPRVNILYRNWLNGWGAVAVKGIMVVAMIVAIGFYPEVGEMKRNLVAEQEREKVNSMAPDERYWYEEQKRREAQSVEDARLKAEAKLERERIERVAKEWDAKEAERDKLASIKQQEDIRLENSRQREFYNELGSPKLLYKCNSSDLEKAIGAKYGNINSLLSGAQENCGSAGYQILKRED